MTDRTGEGVEEGAGGGMMTNAGCVMRKSAARETKILRRTFSLLSVQEQKAVCVCLYPFMCVCGHVKIH